MPEWLQLLWGTVILRPYVFVFLAVYLVAGSAHMGWRRTLVYLPVGYGLAWISELSSIHLGFPYGDYYYIPDTVDRELWVLGVPFMDSLSYVFLSYCSYNLAIFLLSPVVFKARNAFILETRAIRRSSRVWALGACLFVLLDIIIDPVALQGYRWFLGQIYGYRHPGIYFGIPMSNFGGWLLVGVVLVGALQGLDRVASLDPGRRCAHASIPWIGLLGPALYLGIVVFNLAITFWIGEHLLGVTGCLILAVPTLLGALFSHYKHLHATRGELEAHLNDFADSPASALKRGDSGHALLLDDAIQII
ncbi:MAG: carotenoid biosynthesis protein [Syntrophobacteraceae bacterium]